MTPGLFLICCLEFSVSSRFIPTPSTVFWMAALARAGLVQKWEPGTCYRFPTWMQEPNDLGCLPLLPQAINRELEQQMEQLRDVPVPKWVTRASRQNSSLLGQHSSLYVCMYVCMCIYIYMYIYIIRNPDFQKNYVYTYMYIHNSVYVCT